MRNDLIIEREPFSGFMPDDIRNWLAENTHEKDIALSMMIVYQKTGILLHECDEANDPWIDYALEKWYELEEELVEMIIEILATDNHTNHVTEGTQRIIEPFMKRNGFINRDGWWVRIDSEQ